MSTLAACSTTSSQQETTDKPATADPPRPTQTATDTATAAPTATSPASASATATGTATNLPAAKYSKRLNPTDKEGRAIYYSGAGKCYVERPDKTPPNAPPGMVATDPATCPAAFQDAAWEECKGGRLSGSDEASDCHCFISGNPPPPARHIACPTK
jgi:hypothetical protein